MTGASAVGMAASVIGEDGEFVADTGMKPVEQRHREVRAGDVHCAGDRRLVVGRAGEVHKEVRAGAQLKVAGVQDAGCQRVRDGLRLGGMTVTEKRRRGTADEIDISPALFRVEKGTLSPHEERRCRREPALHPDMSQ